MKINTDFKLWKFIDKSVVLLSILPFFLLKLLMFKYNKKEIRKILVVEFLGFGDCVLTLSNS